MGEGFTHLFVHFNVKAVGHLVILKQIKNQLFFMNRSKKDSTVTLQSCPGGNVSWSLRTLKPLFSFFLIWNKVNRKPQTNNECLQIWIPQTRIHTLEQRCIHLWVKALPRPQTESLVFLGLKEAQQITFGITAFL